MKKIGESVYSGKEGNEVVGKIILLKSQSCSYILAIDRRQAVGFGVVEGDVHAVIILRLKYSRCHLY